MRGPGPGRGCPAICAVIDRVRRVWCHRAYVGRIADTLPKTIAAACVIGGCLCAALISCGDDGGSSATIDGPGMMSSVADTGVFGSVAVQLFAEASNIPTITAGARPGEIVDGWELRYSKLLVAVGDFKAEIADPGGSAYEVGDGNVQIVDLTLLPSEGHELRLYERVETGTSSQVGFAVPNAGVGAEQSAYASDADYELMVKNGYAVYIEGSITKSGGESCVPGVPDKCEPNETIRFAWGLQAGAAHSNCAGILVEDSTITNVALTLPGDRWLQVDFSRTNSVRRAQWIADADLDVDGEVTLTELESIAVADLFPDDLYDLSRPLSPVTTARDFLVAQAQAMGSAGLGTCSQTTPL
jgi:hypothetical protein